MGKRKVQEMSSLSQCANLTMFLWSKLTMILSLPLLVNVSFFRIFSQQLPNCHLQFTEGQKVE